MDFSLTRLLAAGLAAAAAPAIAQTAPVNASPAAVLHPLVAYPSTNENYRRNLQQAMLQATGDEMAALATAAPIAELEAKLQAGLPANMVSGLDAGATIGPHTYVFTLVVSSDFEQPVSVCMERHGVVTTAYIFPDGTVQLVEPLARSEGPVGPTAFANPREPRDACMPHSAKVVWRMLDALNAQLAAGGAGR